MRKTSYDGGDSTSITSGVENEIKKSAMKPKKTSLKRKAPSFSQESDDTVNEPLLQRDKEKSEAQSAKYFGKGKTESSFNKESDNNAKTTPATTGFCGTTESLLSFKDSESTKTTSNTMAPLHNYMNTNVFNTRDNTKVNATTKSQILVEIDTSKQSGYSPSPLIFTTAKIHTDAKTKQMEPVHVTPVPILSTIEVSVSKGGAFTTNEKKISNGSSVISPVYTPVPLTKNKEDKASSTNYSTVFSPTSNKDVFAKAIPITSAAKPANNNTTVQITTLPSTNYKPSSMISNTKYYLGDKGDSSKEQSLPNNTQPQIISPHLETARNNVTVKTITACTEKSNTNISPKVGQDGKCHMENLVKHVHNSSAESQHSAKNIKTSISSNPLVEISQPAKNTIASDKQLLRQKTTTENIIDTEKSAKSPSLSYTKTGDDISITDNDKLPTVSAKDTRSVKTKSSLNNTANLIGNSTPTTTSIKPISTKVTTSDTVSSSCNVVSTTSSIKPITANVTTSDTASSSYSVVNTPVTSTAKEVSSTPTSSNGLSNINKTYTAPAVTTSPNTVFEYPDSNKPKILNIPTSISTSSKKADVTPVQTLSSISKPLENVNELNGAAKVSSPKISDGTKTASAISEIKPSGITTTATTSQSTANTTSKIAISKIPTVTTSVKTSLDNSVTSSKPKPISSSTNVPNSGIVSSVKIPTTNTLTSKSSTATSVISTHQNNTSATKQAKTKDVTGDAKTPSVVAAKSSMINSNAALIASGIKSPNNNSSQTFEPPIPPTTSISKTEPAVTSSSTSAGNSTTLNSTVSANKTSPGSLPATTSTSSKESALVKKPTLSKTQPITTKSPSATSVSKPISGSTVKSSTEASSIPVSASKKSGASALPKTSTKSPTVSAITKASGVSSSSSSTTPKLTTVNASQASANIKSIGTAGPSVPSPSPVLKSSESIKKGGSKSSDNKDVNVSKA